MRVIKILYISSFSIAATLFLLGISTYWWVPVEAKISYINNKNICLSGYTSTNRYDLNSTRNQCSYTTVRYYYNVEDTTYSSSFIGFVIPINISLEKKSYGNLSRAYYAPFFANFSVLKNGVDYFLILTLLLFGWILFYIRASIIKFHRR
jgi:hypothetical protein